MTKIRTPKDQEKYDVAVEKFERGSRKRKVDRSKASKAAEAKITDLTGQVQHLSETLLRVRKAFAWCHRRLPPAAKQEFEEYRHTLNGELESTVEVE